MAGEFDINAELWQLANIVTGFAVAQGIAFALALGGDLGRLQSSPPRAKVVLTIVSILFASAYSIAVERCLALASLEPGVAAVWREVTCGRHVAIWLFTALGVFGLFAPNLLGRPGGSKGV